MAMAKTTSVYLVDDHEIILPGIRMFIETNQGFSVVGTATDGQAAYEGIRELRPDIAVLDLSIPLLSGFELVAKFRQEGGPTRFIILTSYSDDKYIKEALALKVEGYILKENPSTELIATLDAVSRGLNYMAPRIMTRIMQGLSSGGNQGSASVASDQLTEREKQVLRLIGSAHSGKDICVALHISDSTMKAHKGAILRKLGLKNSKEILLYARNNDFA